MHEIDPYIGSDDLSIDMSTSLSVTSFPLTSSPSPFSPSPFSPSPFSPSPFSPSTSTSQLQFNTNTNIDRNLLENTIESKNIKLDILKNTIEESYTRITEAYNKLQFLFKNGLENYDTITKLASEFPINIKHVRTKEENNGRKLECQKRFK